MAYSPSKAAALPPSNLPSDGPPSPVTTVGRRFHGSGGDRLGERSVPEEVAVAFTYDGTTHAVMMATPADLEDLAVGFTLTEGIVADPALIESVEVIAETIGIELRMRLAGAVGEAFRRRRRMLAGPVGCGLCGIESLAEAMRPPAAVTGGPIVAPWAIVKAVAGIATGQLLNRETRAVHGAAFCGPDGAPMTVREDVGRHNALDKLVGALARAGRRAGDGMIVVTSRVSVELVQKASVIGAPILVAVSAPTALAIRTAEAAGMTLVAVARGNEFEVFAGGHRIAAEEDRHGHA